MSTLQKRRYAKKWLKLAISKNELANFAIGLPPYAEIKSKYEPILVPNLEVLYAYYEESKESNFDQDVENAVIQIVEECGDNECIILHTLRFVVTHLAYEKRGAAKFSLDCSKLLDEIKKKVINNKRRFQKKNGTDDVWDLIEFYDSLLREQHDLHFLI